MLKLFEFEKIFDSLGEVFEIAEAPHLEGFEKFVILRWREDFIKVSKWSTISGNNGILNTGFPPVQSPVFLCRFSLRQF